jgi:hypothetical protein
VYPDLSFHLCLLFHPNKPISIYRLSSADQLSCYNAIGLDGLTDRLRRPYRHANQLPAQIETRIVRLKRDKPSWGALKDQGEARPALSGRAHAGDQHGPYRSRSPRPGQAQWDAWPSTPTGNSLINQAWNAHLNALGITALKVNPAPVVIATEGAL